MGSKILCFTINNSNSQLNINYVYKTIHSQLKGTLFGTSSILYEEKIYVGAPVGQNGGIFRCDVDTERCEKKLKVPDALRNHKNSMFGISMTSFEDTIFACAPRTKVEQMVDYRTRNSGYITSY